MSRTEKRLMNMVARACQDFDMLEDGDRVMVCLSGGKDSYAMLHLLRGVQRKVPFELSLVAVNLDQKQPGFPEEVLPTWLSENAYDYRIVERDTYSVVKEMIPEGSTYCSLCSRLRRGILYDVAQELGATKIALGHHRDDLIETLLLNVFYSGQLKSMPPRLRSDDGRNVVIRPLAYCPEEMIAAFAQEQAFPIIPCDLCGSQENLKRQRVKELIATLHSDNDCVKGNMLAALGNVRVSHLLDHDLWERCGLTHPQGRDDILDSLGDAADGGTGDTPPPRMEGRAELSSLRISSRDAR